VCYYQNQAPDKKINEKDAYKIVGEIDPLDYSEVSLAKVKQQIHNLWYG